MFVGPSAVRRSVPGQPEEMIALVQGQAQCPGDRPQHARRRLRRTILLQTGVVVRGDVGQARDLLTAQPGSAPTPRAGEADVPGVERLPAHPQEIRQLLGVHPSSLHHSRTGSQRPPIPG